MNTQQTWKGYETAAEKGPFALVMKFVGLFFMVAIVVAAIGYSLGWFSSAAKVVQQEFGPEVAMQKYGWFKNVAAQLDKKRADVQVYESRIKAMDGSYKTLSRERWPREDREQYNVWQSEIAGAKASYNSLAAEYNAAMAKFNWSYANVGGVPKGSDPLPHDFPEYMSK